MARAPVLRNRSPHSLQGAPRDHTSRKRRPAVSRLRTPARAPTGSTWVVPFVPDPLPTPPPKDDEGSGRWLTRHLKTTASRLGPRVISPGASQPMLDGAIAQGDPAEDSEALTQRSWRSPPAGCPQLGEGEAGREGHSSSYFIRKNFAR